MSFFNWRKLNFFDVAKEVDGGAVAKLLDPEASLTCAVSGRGTIVLGDSKGSLWMINRHWEATRLAGWEGQVEQLVMPRQSGILAGLGLDNSIRCLKVWDLDKVDKAGVPKLLRVSRLSLPGPTPSEATCLAVSDNLQMMAAGFESGAVYLYRGDIGREKGQKQKCLLEHGDPVSGLCFVTASTGSYLYLATTRDIYLFDVGTNHNSNSRKEVASKPLLLDRLGCERDLWTATAPNFADAHFVTGQKDALYFYNPEGRGQCYVFEGRKRLLHWHRGYLIVVTEDLQDKVTVTIFDVQNKIIAFSAPMKPFLCVVAEWGALFLVTREGSIAQLVEKDLQSKLGLLFKKNFYDVAVKIARSQQYDKEGLVDIFRQYGDHLYEKGDHAGAIDQYEKTIGTLEPSYVIRKFLDAQKIHSLTAYLQALHRKGEATEDHTTLLLNCYTKLKDSQKLDEFIMTKDREVDFDVSIAISVCRQAGYCQHALALAEKHAKHELYLQIQIDNEKDYHKALEYISRLPPGAAEAQMRKYGVVLMENAAQPTAQLIKQLCGDSSTSSCHPEEFIPLFINNPVGMIDFLEHCVANRSSVSSEMYNTLIEYTLHQYKSAATSHDEAAKKTTEKRILDILESDTANYDSDQAMVLCQLAEFAPGVLLMYQKAGLHQEILKHHFMSGNYEAGILACRRFGPQNPQLWVTALQHVAAAGGEVPPHHFKEVLDSIEHHRLLSPLQVVTTLSTCPTATLGVVRDYLLRTLQAEEKAISEDKKAIEQYRKETAQVREKVRELKTEAVIFQSTKCSGCNHPLELPTVHFLCQHGYHQLCFQSLADNEQDCPGCQVENKKILDIIKSQEAGRSQHDQFHAQLEKAEDGFSIIAEYFGRGLFSQPAVLPGDMSKPVPAIKRQEPASRIEDNMSSLSLTEARIRASDPTTRQQPAGNEPRSEARLRAEEGSHVAPPAPSEGRLRAEAAARALHKQSEVPSTTTEGRLRAEAAARTPHPQREISSTTTEGRLRAGQTSQVAMSVPSDARLRLREGEISAAAARSPIGSLTANLTRPSLPPPRASPQPLSPPIRSHRSISPQNPFGSPDSNESLGENNPFASAAPTANSAARKPRAAPPAAAPPSSSSANPFGDDYDDELNPFAE